VKKISLGQATEAFAIESHALLQMADRLDKKSFMKAVKILAEAPRIATSGCGHAGIACMHFAHLMCCIERPARFISPAEAVHGASGFMQSGDVMVLVSRGGKTSELVPIAKICKEKKVTVICVTENSESPLALNSDIVLGITVTREVDRDNQQGTTSFTVMCVLFHALQAVLIEEINFIKEQFALIHPGGAVGERLNRKKEKQDENDSENY
jgi:D-arabinose 5-phosphate isomerase GutQ